MVVIKALLFLLLSTTMLQASEIEKAFRAKRYDLIAMGYRAQPKRKYTDKELVMISKALRDMKFYRDDINLNVRLINAKFRKQHRFLLESIQKKRSIDGDKFHKFQKNLYWNIYSNYAALILGYSRPSLALDKDYKHFQTFQKILSELEYQESQVDKLSDRIAAHLTYLRDSVYRFSASVSMKYISWQRGAELTDTDGNKTRLILTNRGNCIGGDIGMENNTWHFYLDGCFLLGSGGVSAFGDPNIQYQQSNLPAYGAQIGPGASMIVSSTKARLGLRLPFIYTVQNLTAPPGGNYTISSGGVASLFGALYSRWHLGKWYLQTEFGTNMGNQDNFWSLGFGRSF
jgi:hypothetical protein